MTETGLCTEKYDEDSEKCRRCGKYLSCTNDGLGMDDNSPPKSV